MATWRAQSAWRCAQSLPQTRFRAAHCHRLRQALAALLTFRRPEVTISPETGLLEEHSPELREPLPLSLHHLPVTIAFALFESANELVVADPSLSEEQTCAGAMLVRALRPQTACVR